MIRHIALLACLAATIATLAPASACSIWTEPPLPGETDEAYRIRVVALEQEQAVRWAKDRQVRALTANLIFIARNREWTPPAPHPKPLPKLRPGQPPPPPVLIPPVLIQFPAPDYFKPVAWFRGPKITDLFQLRADNTTCGLSGLGDTTHSQPGDVFIFFARKSPVTRDTLIDAIALDKIDDPALLEFVAKYRRKD